MKTPHECSADVLRAYHATDPEFQVRLEIELIAYAEAIRQACAEAAFGQQYDNPRSETDHVYNLAAADCNRAIRAIDLL